MQILGRNQNIKISHRSIYSGAYLSSWVFSFFEQEA